VQHPVRRSSRRGAVIGFDVVTVVALVTFVALFTVVVVGCGGAGVAVPPEPEFRPGVRAEPADASDLEPSSDAERIDPSDIEADGIDIDTETWFSIDDTGAAIPDPAGWDRFDEIVSARLVPPNVSASVAVMVDGRIVHASAFGERVEGTGDSVEVTDRFRIASISKTITAIVVLQLVEDGSVGIDDDIGPLVADHLALDTVDADVAGLTVRRLLSHTSGFPQHDSMFFGGAAPSCRDAAAQAMSGGVGPGGSARYSNMNYCVLGILVEALTGRTYERVVDERLLTPLGIVGMRTTGTYELGPDEVSHHPSPGRNFMETLAAAGAWNATPTDVVTIVNSVDPTTPGWKALSAEMMRSMRSRTPSGSEPTGYGLGIINYGGGTWGHTGTIQNAASMVAVEPDGFTWAITVSGSGVADADDLRSVFRQSISESFG
jgi:D-alanyl-D-alanine carboxypeptidase